MTLFMALTVLFSITACKSGEDNANENTAPNLSSQNETPDSNAPEKKDVTLSVMHWRVEDAEIMDELIADFQKEYPHITVEIDSNSANYTSALSSRLTSGEADVVAVDPLGQLINKMPGVLTGNALYDLTGQEFISYYNPSTIDKNAIYEEKVLAIPATLNTDVVFYNKDMFAEHGIEEPQTWDEFIEAADKLAEAGISPFAFGGKEGWPINMPMLAVEANNLRNLDKDFYTKVTHGEAKFTDQIFVDMLTKTQDLYSRFDENALGIAYGDAPILFAQGKAGMMVDGSWMSLAIQDAEPQFEVGTFLIPGEKATDKLIAPVKYGICWAINNKSQHVEESLLFLDYISRPENYKRYIIGVEALPTQDGIEFNDPLLTQIAKLLGNNVQFMDQLYPPGSGLDPWQTFQEMAVGIKTPEQVAQFMQDKVDAIQN